MSFRLFSIVALIGGILFSQAASADSVRLADRPMQHDLTGKLDVFVTEQGGLSRHALETAPFVPFTKSVPSFGITTDTYWFRLGLDNPGLSPRSMVIEVPAAWVDLVEVITPSGKRLRAGDRLPFFDRPHPHPNYLYRFDAPPGESTVYLSMHSADLLAAPIILWDQRLFAKQDRLWWMYYGLLFGTLGMMLVYNLFLYFSVRDSSYLYYVLYLSGFLVMAFTYNGFSYYLFWPGHPLFANWAQFLCISAYMGGGLLFVVNFLDTRRNLPRLHQTIKWFATILGMFFVIAVVFLEFPISVQILMGLLDVNSILLILVGYHAWRRGIPAARFFMLATVAGMFGVTLTASAIMNLIPFTFFTYHAAEFGIIADVLLLSLALADRINTMRTEKEQAELNTLHVLKMARDDLEEKVQARTLELEEARSKAETMARTDDLTGMDNRRAFMRTLKRELSRSKRTDKPLSVIALDLDHFKRINDTHGHATGDLVLKAFADVIRDNMRDMDVAGRIGGEEFSICLPDAGLDQAAQVAERIRAATDAATISVEGKIIDFTTSIGICAFDGEQSLESLLACADARLYAAKEAGRNRVVSE